MAKPQREPAPLSGQRWRQTHQFSIDAILGPGVRRVKSEGDSFYNVDRWVARSFAAAMCGWAELNPGRTPSRYDVERWVHRANQAAVPRPEIVIAATPDDLPRGTGLALTGGAYHEAFHTLYSRTKALHVDEVWEKIQNLWGLAPYLPHKGLHGWRGLTGALLHWGNIIEDIRIERLGCVQFPGIREKMVRLQDLILEQEEKGIEANAHRALGQSAHSVIMGTFRDLGLGYKSDAQDLALDRYLRDQPDAFRMVESGPLRVYMDASINLTAKDDMSHLWLAMAVVGKLVETASNNPPPPPPPEGDGNEESGGGADGQSSDQPQSGGGSGQKQKGKVWKAGDRARLKTGPHAGKEVEVVLAGLPDPKTGKQELEYALVLGE